MLGPADRFAPVSELRLKYFPTPAPSETTAVLLVVSSLANLTPTQLASPPLFDGAPIPEAAVIAEHKGVNRRRAQNEPMLSLTYQALLVVLECDSVFSRRPIRLRLGVCWRDA
jgi:hypothetical protein